MVLAETVRRVAADVHPPLYFIILNGWTAAVGESIYGARMLSTLFGMLGLVVTYRIGKELFDDWTGLITIIWLGTSSFFIYYTHEIRMYSMLLCMATLSMRAYLRWLHRPTPARLAIYGVTLAWISPQTFHPATITCIWLFIVRQTPNACRYMRAMLLTCFGAMPWCLKQ